MRFSVIVPVYNVEKYIRQCLDSLVHQTFRNYEMIVIDDGSTDSSGRICDAYGERYASVHVIHQKNQGLSGARNRGLSEAKGEWLIFVDSDDWVNTDMLERMDAYISFYQADLYRFNIQKTGEEGNQTEKLLFAVENSSVLFTDEADKFRYCFHKFLQYKTGWEVCGGIYRRDMVRRHHLRFADTKSVFAEDLLFTYQYLLHIDHIVQVCDVFYHYRQRETSLLHSALTESILDRLSVLGEFAYQTICREHMKYFRKNYYLLYFMLMNHHIEYKLAGVSDEDLRRMLRELNAHKLHGRFMRVICLHRTELMQYMTTRVWI